MAERVVAVIVDIVDSKKLTDRRRTQSDIEVAFDLVNERVRRLQPLRASVGDEFQAVYPDIPGALEATLLARLGLPAGVDCRFGLGMGDVVDVGMGSTGALQDGSAWWLAREAIDEAHEREKQRTPTLRGWFRADGDDGREPLVNAYLLARDHIVGAMTDRARRLTFGTLCGLRQDELADREKITQSAVSQALRRSGGSSLIAALDELEFLR